MERDVFVSAAVVPRKVTAQQRKGGKRVPGEERSKEQTIILEGRKKLSVSGVVDVQSYDEEQVILETTLGMLTIHGQKLHMERLQLEIGELLLEGESVDGFLFDDGAQPRGGWFSRLFGG